MMPPALAWNRSGEKYFVSRPAEGLNKTARLRFRQMLGYFERQGEIEFPVEL
jgi:hypothetical protein